MIERTLTEERSSWSDRFGISLGLELENTKLKPHYLSIYIGEHSVANRHQDVPQAPHRLPVCLLVSSLRCHGMATSTRLRFLASPTIVASNAVWVLVAHDLCIRSSHAAHARLTRIGYRLLRGSCVMKAFYRSLRGHRQLQAVQGIEGV